MANEVLAQVTIVVDTDDDLVWAEQRPGLSRTSQDLLLSLLRMHTSEQQNLRRAVHRARFALAALQRGQTPEIALPRVATIVHEIELELVKVNECRWRLKPHVTVIDDRPAVLQHEWIEREIGPLRELLRQPADRTAAAAHPNDTNLSDPSDPQRQRGRAGRPPGNGVFRSDDDARDTLGRAVRALTTPTKQATQDAVRRWIQVDEPLRGPVSRRALIYWVKERLGYPDWPTFRDGVQ